MTSISSMNQKYISSILTLFLHCWNYLFWGFSTLFCGIVRNNSWIVLYSRFILTIQLNSEENCSHLMSSHGKLVSIASKSLAYLPIIWNQSLFPKIQVKFAVSFFWRLLCNFPLRLCLFLPYPSNFCISFDLKNGHDLKYHSIFLSTRVMSRIFSLSFLESQYHRHFRFCTQLERYEPCRS